MYPPFCVQNPGSWWPLFCRYTEKRAILNSKKNQNFNKNGKNNQKFIAFDCRTIMENTKKWRFQNPHCNKSSFSSFFCTKTGVLEATFLSLYRLFFKKGDKASQNKKRVILGEGSQSKLKMLKSRLKNDVSKKPLNYHKTHIFLKFRSKTGIFGVGSQNTRLSKYPGLKIPGTGGGGRWDLAFFYYQRFFNHNFHFLVFGDLFSLKKIKKWNQT